MEQIFLVLSISGYLFKQVVKRFLISSFIYVDHPRPLNRRLAILISIALLI